MTARCSASGGACTAAAKRVRSLWLAMGMLATASHAAGSGEELRSPNQLKTLTLEEILDTKVISGTRTMENWKTTAAAIAVVPEETIRASGAVRLAEVL